MEGLKKLDAVKIHECYKTNSSPLRVECQDGSQYIVKTFFSTNPPLVDLINEVLCNYILQIWNIPVATQALISIDNLLVESFVNEGKYLDKRYNNFKTSSLHFYGTEFINTITELDVFNLNLKNKYDFNRYVNSLDFVRIAIFDKWIANMDRRKGNANLLLSVDHNGFIFIPIDHTQAFACQATYKNLKLSIMDRADQNSIMLTPIFKSICTFTDTNDLKNLKEVILSNINDTLAGIDNVFSYIPKEFGLSKDGKAKIKEVLSNIERNKRISTLYLSYLK